jgi:hypothetical protein
LYCHFESDDKGNIKKKNKQKIYLNCNWCQCWVSFKIRITKRFYYCSICFDDEHAWKHESSKGGINAGIVSDVNSEHSWK